MVEVKNLRLGTHRPLLPSVQAFIDILKEGYAHALLLYVMSVLDPGEVASCAAGLAGIIFPTDTRFSFDSSQFLLPWDSPPLKPRVLTLRRLQNMATDKGCIAQLLMFKQAFQVCFRDQS